MYWVPWTRTASWKRRRSGAHPGPVGQGGHQGAESDTMTVENMSHVGESSRADVDVHLKATSTTKFEHGRLSMLVDLGSRINVVGANTQREMALEAERHGHKTVYNKRKHRLNVNGVGRGSAPCDEEATTPIAVSCHDSRPTLEKYEANVATGSGADLPAIYGSASMQEHDCVLLLRKGREVVAFP